MAFEIDIQENWLLKRYPTAFKALLIDHSTRVSKEEPARNIFWATDSYAERGEGYQFDDEISIQNVTGENGDVIKPRSVKSNEEQVKRIKDKAEVFTPSWVCNTQNNLVDEAWFGRPNVFNEEFIDEDGERRWRPTEGKIDSFPKGKTWKDYINETRLEITCGEAPYLVSRYDTTTGKAIEIVEGEGTPDRHIVFNRIGLLDRKLRLICENVDEPSKWLYYVEKALHSTYGFEWQGDNLLLARENLLLTVKDYYDAMFPDVPISGQSMKSFAYIISWNLWQMDGLTYGLPGKVIKEKLPFEERSLFGNPAERQERYCRIMNWKYREWLVKNKSKKPEAQKAYDNEEYKQIFALIARK